MTLLDLQNLETEADTTEALASYLSVWTCWNP
ncbi:SapB/AmfS family lanthipeptide [Streptomyces carpaticus]|nr:SapB/AmfS family lanthipeptide [Streptomyces sp. XM4011]MCK1816782.1 SapB/AmfS family lanthipeptide [Streptomyces sp. XM4011]UWM51088.1 SapB/AmfS family lanthipeptide [Streptomyces carpaticus]